MICICVREIVRQCLGAVEFAGDGGQAREGKSTPAPPHMHAKRVRNASERPGIPCSAVLADLHLSPSPLTWRPCSRCEKGFKIEYAKSGRAGCKGCGQKIEQGGLRLGKMIPSPHFDGYVSCVCARAREKVPFPMPGLGRRGRLGDRCVLPAGCAKICVR